MTTTDHHAPAPAGAPLRVFAEDWDPSYGSPATFDWDDSGTVERVEDGAGHVPGRVDARVPLAFVDGVRRAELRLWAEDGHGVRIPGLAGAYAVGAVTVRPGMGAEFSGERVGRLAVWGRGHHGDLAGSHGFRWASESTTADEPDELLLHLHERMRAGRGRARPRRRRRRGGTRCSTGRSTASRACTASSPATSRRTAASCCPTTSTPGCPRSPSASARACTPTAPTTTPATSASARPVRRRRRGPASPASHFPSVAGLDAVVAEADVLAGTLPAFAGVAHRDPRAPVNLTPVRNLERHLTHALGNARLARRAARDALLTGAAPMTLEHTTTAFPGCAGRRDGAARPRPPRGPHRRRPTQPPRRARADPGRHRGRARRRLHRRHHAGGRRADRRRRRPQPRHVRRQPAAPRRRHRAVPLRHRHRGDGSGRGRRDGHRHRPPRQRHAAGPALPPGRGDVDPHAPREVPAAVVGRADLDRRRRAPPPRPVPRQDVRGRAAADRPRHERRDRLHAVLVPQRRQGRPRLDLGQVRRGDEDQLRAVPPLHDVRDRAGGCAPAAAAATTAPSCSR